jgi:hypothetical protein
MSCTYVYSGCTAAPVCGNGVREGVEACDGGDLNGQSCVSLGFGAGSLACGAGCSFDTTGCPPAVACGNGTVEGSEQCDGMNLGGASCESLGYGGGTLGCTGGCQWDPWQCYMCGNNIVEPGEECDGFMFEDSCGIGCTGGGYCQDCDWIFLPCECCNEFPDGGDGGPVAPMPCW